MGAKEEDLQCDPKACLFPRGVGIFALTFLSHFLTKMRTSCAHQKGNFLNFSKLTLLLSIVHFWDPLWPVKHKRAFFLRHPVSNSVSHLVHWLLPLGFLFLWYSMSSTVHTAPFTFSTRLKHLWRLRLCRTAFWNKQSLMRVLTSVLLDS